MDTAIIRQLPQLRQIFWRKPVPQSISYLAFSSLFWELEETAVTVSLNARTVWRSIHRLCFPISEMRNKCLIPLPQVCLTAEWGHQYGWKSQSLTHMQHLPNLTPVETCEWPICRHRSQGTDRPLHSEASRTQWRNHPCLEITFLITTGLTFCVTIQCQLLILPRRHCLKYLPEALWETCNGDSASDLFEVALSVDSTQTCTLSDWVDGRCTEPGA